FFTFRRRFGRVAPAAPESANRRDRVAVLRPGLLVGAERRRAVLAVGDRGDAAGSDALGHEIIAGGVRAALAESDVVFLGPALVAVAGDLHVVLRILRQPGRLTVQRPLALVLQRRLVEVEEHPVADIRDEILLAAGRRACRLRRVARTRAGA